MSYLRSVWIAVVLAVLAQGCATTKSSKAVAKKKTVPPKQNQSFALMEDDIKIDAEILRRGNKARGLSEY